MGKVIATRVWRNLYNDSQGNERKNVTALLVFSENKDASHNITFWHITITIICFATTYRKFSTNSED